MSFTEFAVLIVVAWCVIGFAVSVAMRRRGHAFFTWWYLGTILGPLSVPLAIDAVAHEGHVPASDASPGSPSDRVTILVGVDGSDESVAAARSAVELFGDRIGQLTLATVIDFEAHTARREAQHGDADAVLERAAAAIGVACDRRVLVGSAADALADAARDGDYDAIVVGSRGRGASRALLGSVATRLARGVGVPVLIGGVPAHVAAGTSRA
jgi:nucleotide-binding universal stress UspA family protein